MRVVTSGRPELSGPLRMPNVDDLLVARLSSDVIKVGRQVILPHLIETKLPEGRERAPPVMSERVDVTSAMDRASIVGKPHVVPHIYEGVSQAEVSFVYEPSP